MCKGIVLQSVSFGPGGGCTSPDTEPGPCNSCLGHCLVSRYWHRGLCLVTERREVQQGHKKDAEIRGTFVCTHFYSTYTRHRGVLKSVSVFLSAIR